MVKSNPNFKIGGNPKTYYVTYLGMVSDKEQTNFKHLKLGIPSQIIIVKNYNNILATKSWMQYEGLLY